MADINCPYCDAEIDINHDDGFGYEEGVKHHQECHRCNKSFVFETSISFYYDPEKADCLNGAPHDYKATRTFPYRYTMMECSACEDRRYMTDQEKLLFITERQLKASDLW